MEALTAAVTIEIKNQDEVADVENLFTVLRQQCEAEMSISSV